MRRATPAVLGIDVGTSETKTGLIALDGQPLGIARAAYGVDVDAATGRAEQDADDWWSAVAATVREVLAGRQVDVLAIAVDGHGPTLAPVDAVGRPVAPAVTWLDTRPRGELDELAAATGLRGWSLGVLPAALWLERHDAGLAARARWYLNTWEAIALRLTGRAATSLVSGQAFPRPDVLAAAGLSADRVAPPVAAGTVLGNVTREAAAALGVAGGTPVVAGVVDAFASFHGAGLRAPGDALDAGGAAGGFGVYWDRPIAAAGAFSTPAPLPGLYSVGGAMAATGKAVDWLRDAVLGGGLPTDRLIAEAAAVGPGADGLVFLPYLAGERSPLWDPSARGAFVGLTLGHGRAHLVRAVLEAAALAIRHVAEPILAAGARVSAMRVTGGPARSEAWNRIKADVTGFPVEVPHVLETAAVGSAILAATGVGAHPDLPSAIAAMTRIDRRIEPRAELASLYDELYRGYVELYPAIAPAVRRLDAVTRLGPGADR